MLKLYRKIRGMMYKGARGMGNVQPWLELSPRKIIRRYVFRWMGRSFVAPLFGGSGPLGFIARLFGIGR